MARIIKVVLLPAALVLFIIPVAHAEVCNVENGFMCSSGFTCDTANSICRSNSTVTPSTVVPGGTVVPSGSGQLLNPFGEGATLPSLLAAILEFVVRIGAVVVVLMLVYVGFLFVTARGNETKLTAAKSGLLWTVVGALILLGAQAIASGIQATVDALSTGT